MDIAEAFAARNYVICCSDLSCLEEKIRQAKETEFTPMEEEKSNVEDIILDFMNLFS
jgi:hypothetical protein